jgi:hypothetical protein
MREIVKGIPKVFITAEVKADVPQEIREFFEASEKARREAIESHLKGIDAAQARWEDAKRRRLPSDELEIAARRAYNIIASNAPAVATLLRDVAYVAHFETTPQASDDRVLKQNRVLRFGRPVKIVRVIDNEHVLIVVDEQHRLPQRRNRSGQTIEPLELKRVQAVVKTDTAGMKDGVRTQIPGTLYVTGTQEIDGADIFVLEPFRAFDYLVTATVPMPWDLAGNALSTEVGEIVPDGFVAAKVKPDVPDDIRAFFEASDKARLAAIGLRSETSAGVGAKSKAAKRRARNPNQPGQLSDKTNADAAARRAVIPAIFTDRGYVAPFESSPRAAEQKVLEQGLILRFGHSVNVERVIDKDRAVIIVEERRRTAPRLNSAGQTIEPLELKRVPAVVRTDTSSMRNGGRTQIKETLRVAGRDTIDGVEVFVLEPFPVADYLEQ